jgi:homoserine acetyltransferase
MNNHKSPQWNEEQWQQRFQRMKDDQMVNPYMAKIDTRIDRIVLEWRMTDAIIDNILKDSKHLDMHERFRVERIVAEQFEHNHRDSDLQQMIEEIRACDGFNIPAERDAYIGFGPYDANDDKYLSLVLDYAGPDFADDETGDTEFGEHVMRFGRCLLGTNDQGFRTLVIHDHEVEAIAEFHNIDNAYSAWMSAQDEE